jgi:1-deoxy-D-xylulose 5-phosphate reductoisomerase
VRFPDIWQIVEAVMNRHTSVAHPDLDAILQADQWARIEAHRHVKSIKELQRQT